ncbi:MAG: 30S ribosomal protein S2, partial [SAR324 cluster bacterium]|nr:30S ribosomal protein S2 [SAR324 cluster bacterium]
PSLIVLLNVKGNENVIKEATKKSIPVMAILDTDIDPKGIQYPVPGNDDSPKAVRLFASVIATGILEGRASRASISTADSGTPAEISQAAPAAAESEPKTEESDSADNEVTDTPATPE